MPGTELTKGNDGVCECERECTLRKEQSLIWSFPFPAWTCKKECHVLPAANDGVRENCDLTTMGASDWEPSKGIAPLYDNFRACHFGDDLKAAGPLGG